MMRIQGLQFGIVAQILSFCLGSTKHTNYGRPIVIDTDIFSDCDDVGALAVANLLHNCGLADLRGVMINTHSRYGALAANAVNTYFGNGDIPIAALKPLTNETFFDTYKYTLSEFASKLAHNFPRTLSSSSETLLPLDLYTKLLEEAEPASLTLISIGFLTNLATLLSSAHGRDLITSRVRELVVMGGRYPSGWEFNFAGAENRSDTATVLRDWPDTVVPITFVGYELGKPILSGHALPLHAPYDSPVRAAYEWYVGRCGSARESWDPITVLYGVLGLAGRGWREIGWSEGDDGPFEYANKGGWNTFDSSTGTTEWVRDGEGDEGRRKQHYLKLRNGVRNEAVADLLDGMFTHDPERSTCPYEWRKDEL